MVFVITGTAESARNTVGRLLAEALGWEFVFAETLHRPAHPGARRCSPSLADTDPTFHIETLSAAIHSWIYEWRDVVVSCPMLTERDRRQLSAMHSLVKIVCLEANDAIRVVSSEFPDGWSATGEPGQEVLRVDSSRQVEEIIAEITAVLIMRKSPCFARN